MFCFVLAVLASPFKSKSRLEAENAVLRHQLIVLRRKVRGRVRLTNNDRWFLIQLYRWFPSTLRVVTIVQPETLVRWHRAGFRCYWRWKSRSRGGRPQIETDLRALIRQMSLENLLWGAPRIHGELLKLGFDVTQSSVAKYMVKRRGPPSQGWRTFSTSSSAGQQVIGKTVSTFKALVDEAEFSAANQPTELSMEASALHSAPASKPSEKTPVETPTHRPSVHIDIQVHISPEASVQQIDQIFSSMAKHLYGRADT